MTQKEKMYNEAASIDAYFKIDWRHGSPVLTNRNGKVQPSLRESWMEYNAVVNHKNQWFDFKICLNILRDLSNYE